MQASQTKPNLADQWLRWFELKPRLTLALLVLACLGPFLSKPFNVDDPLFLWSARQIQAHPLDPYGFNVNWYGWESPMWAVTKNPPLVCYYLAMAAKLLGWRESALHLALLLPAVAAILGTYRLARHFCDRPFFAACATLFTPVFLVSSTSLMCDTMMLAFWVWAVVLWVEGMEQNCARRLAGAAILVTLASLTKYFGSSLIPLLAAYSFIGQRRVGSWAWYFLIPIAVLGAYQWTTYSLYGRGLLSDAGVYVTKTAQFQTSVGAKCLTALTFTGGCLALAAFLIPFLWRPRVVVGFVAVAVTLSLAVFLEGNFWEKYTSLAGTSRLIVAAQIVFWAIGGVGIISLAVADVWQRRDAHSWLLAFWVLGTFLFAGFINWITNGRSILPMAPAVGILLARRLAPGAWGGRQGRPEYVRDCVVAGAVLACLVTLMDFRFARATRILAAATCEEFGHGDGTLWFDGHWGWQYYMQEFKAKEVVIAQVMPKTGDILAQSRNNTNPLTPDKNMAHPLKRILFYGAKWVATSDTEVGAGFYASIWGPLPFAFGNVPPEAAFIYTVGPGLPPTP